MSRNITENIQRFSKIVKAHPEELAAQKIRDVTRAIVVADIKHRSEQERGRFENVTLAGIEAFGIPEFSGICLGGKSSTRLSDTMQMRIMCDVLTLCLGETTPFAMRYSSEVRKAMAGDRRPSVVGYLSYDECEKILDGYYEKLGSYDASLKQVFERTVLYLAQMKDLQPKLDKNCVAITRDCCKNVWLPQDYNSSGFEVRTKIPKSLDGVPGDMVQIVTCYNFGFILDAMIKAIVRDGNGDLAQWGFLNRLQDMSGLSPQCFPVGTGVVPGIREDVYIPYHFLNNQALRVVYSRHFEKSIPISVDGMDNLIRAIRVWLDIE